MTSSAIRLCEEEKEEEEAEEEEEEGLARCHESISRVVGTWPHESPRAGTRIEEGAVRARALLLPSRPLPWFRSWFCWWPGFSGEAKLRSTGATGRVVTWLVSSTASPLSLAREDKEAAIDERARAREAV